MNKLDKIIYDFTLGGDSYVYVSKVLKKELKELIQKEIIGEDESVPPKTELGVKSSKDYKHYAKGIFPAGIHARNQLRQEQRKRLEQL